MARRHNGPKVELKQITPAIAEQLLRNNVRNRKLKSSKVAEYAGMMKEGRWADGVADVDFDVDGVLINGQHTLHAVQQSGVPVLVTFKTNLEPWFQDVLDSHSKRSIADQLSLEGVTNANTVAALAMPMILLDESGSIPMPRDRQTVMPSKRADRLTILDYCRRNQEWLEAVASQAKSRSAKLNSLVPATMLGVLQVAFTRAAPEHGNAWMKQFCEETGECSQPVAAYRRKLRAMNKSSKPWSTGDKYLYAIKSFNAYMARQDIKRFTRKPDEIVTIDVPEGVN